MSLSFSEPARAVLNHHSMKTTLIATALLATIASAHEYHFHKDWPSLPDGVENFGDSHGGIDVDSEGNFYVSVVGGEKNGVQIYDAAGKYLRNLPNARNNFHGFTIVQEDGKDVIYAACLGDPKTAFLKLSTAGEILLEIPLAAIPGEIGNKFALTHADRAPNGDIYLVDGYASDRFLIFGADGAFKRVTAGKGEPWNFKTAHKFAFDHRYDPARILVCDRTNDRLVHLDLEGAVIGVYASGIARPCTVDFHGDLVAVAQLAGGVSLLDKEGKLVKRLGPNDNPKQVNTNNVAPQDWKEGVTTSPHGVTFDKDGNVVTTEWNKWGRLLRWDVKL